MRILLTGALGHIGSYLLHNLSSHLEVEEIIATDNLQSQRFSSLFNIKTQTTIRFYEEDTRNLTKEFLLSKGDIKCIIHLSAMTDASSSIDKRNELFQNNLESTTNIASLARDLQIPIIFPSSTSVYGSQESLVDEENSVLNPQSPYAECKIAEEQIFTSRNFEKSKFAILRFGTIHGTSPGMRFHTAVNKFCMQASLNQEITVWKTALNQKRPYLALNDAAGAIAHVINKKLWDGNIYNVVTENYTVQQVVDFIEKAQGVPCRIRLVDSPIMNQLSYEVATEKFVETGYIFTGSASQDIGSTLQLLSGIRNS
jgi:UDP-glucose 4-epimerase